MSTPIPPVEPADPREKVKLFPAAPGVYLMKDAQGRVLYVGKAKNLRNRAAHYFSRAAAEDHRTADLVKLMMRAMNKIPNIKMCRPAWYMNRTVKQWLDIQRNLGIARNILSTRLQTLVGAGILVRVLYQEEPERYEYRLSEAGKDLYPAIVTLMRWGDRHLSGELGPPVLLRHNPCGHVTEPLLVCSHCREELDPHEVTPERSDADELARSHMNLS